MKTKGLFQILALILGCVTSIQAQVMTEAWARRFSSESATDDRGRAVATDSAGNVIVAGNAEADWLVIKYTEAGLPIWTNRYSGPSNLIDTASAVAVGSNGTVYVTGMSFSVNYSDCVTVAYSEAGVPLWTNRYDGPDHYSDYGRAVAVAPNGNVIMTGSSDAYTGPPYNYKSDYLTIAYSEAGIPLWTNRFNGPKQYWDIPSAVAVSPSGTVFVTGTTDTGSFAGTYEDYATLAYSATGIPLWTNMFNGPANINDSASGMVVNSNGTVYVTGSCSTTNGADFATIAYAESGVPLWTNRFSWSANKDDSASAIALDAEGNVYVTGLSDTGTNSYNWSTVAYSGTGAILWTNRYEGVANMLSSKVAVSADGTVFIGGNTYNPGSMPYDYRYDYTTLAYSGAGVPLWTNRYDGPASTNDQLNALAVSPSGNVFVTGFSHNGKTEDCATLAYSSSGVPLWTNRFDGVVNTKDQLTATVVGPDGTIFVTGKSSGLTKFTTIAYSGSGIPLWTNDFNGAVNTWDMSPALVVNSNGTLFVAGMLSSGGFATVAYSSTGLPLWTNYVSGLAYAAGAAAGPGGKLYLSGYYINKGGAVYRTIAISDTGVTLWNISAGGSLAVDTFGNVFTTVAGYTLACTEAGLPLWTNRYSGASFASLVVAPNGTVCVAGYTSSGNNADYATVVYSNAGVPLWTNRYDGPATNVDAATAIAAGADGTLYVTGYSSGFGSGPSDYATIAYSAAGVPLWTNRYDGPAHGTDQANAVAVSSDGTVFVSGSSFGSSSKDIVTIAYSAAGVPLSTNRYNGPGNGDDIVSKNSLAVAPDGLVVAGTSEIGPLAGLVSDYAVVKYVTTQAGVVNPPDTNNPPAPTIILSPSGEAQLTFYGTSGSSYVLEHTFDLGSNSWVPVQTNTAALDAAVPFTYLPLGPVNFWRIRPLP